MALFFASRTFNLDVGCIYMVQTTKRLPIIYFEGGFLLIYINTQAIRNHMFYVIFNNIFRGCDMALICVKNRLLRVICSLYGALILLDLISVHL